MLQQLINTQIEMIQGLKKNFVKGFINDPETIKAVNDYVDTQEAFVKQAAKTAIAVSTRCVETALNQKLFKV